MSVVIVPNCVRDAINRALDKAVPADIPKDDRKSLYLELLRHFGEHGVIPDFTVKKRMLIPPGETQ